MLPRVQAQRAKDVDENLPPTFLDCDACTFDHEERRAMACGWLAPEERAESCPAVPGASICPGYTTRLPEVIEAARAASWTKRGGLGPLYGPGEQPSALVDAVDILEGAQNEVEREGYRKQREEMKRRRG